MADRRVGDWLVIVEGKALQSDAIEMGFSGEAPSTVQSLAESLGARITVVFCNSEAGHDRLASIAAESSEYVIGVVPDLDLAAFHRVLRRGASGVVWEDTPVSHLADVARAALHHDILLPARLVRMMVTAESEQPLQKSDLDNATSEILSALAEGQTMKEIAASLAYSERTIQRRIANLCLTLGATTPAQAVHLAHRKGLLT